MPESPNNTAAPAHPIIVLSDSDDILTSHPPQLSSSPSNRDLHLNSPHPPTSKRPRIQTPPEPNPPSSTDQVNQPTNTPATNPPPQLPSSSATPVSTKPSHDSGPSVRRRSPATKVNHPEPRPGNNHPILDEEETPLDLAKISSYEYEQVAKLNPVQLRRYEQYRRSDLKNAKVRRLILAINPTSRPTDPYIIAVKGLAKLFVGDIVETALEVKKTVGDKGALQPKHIREAYRRLRRKGAVPFSNEKNNSLN